MFWELGVYMLLRGHALEVRRFKSILFMVIIGLMSSQVPISAVKPWVLFERFIHKLTELLAFNIVLITKKDTKSAKKASFYVWIS